MGQQKPSELLAKMLPFCPRGEENSVFSNCLFLQRLSSKLHILLLEADMANKRLFSERADQVWAHNAQLHHDTVAAVTLDQDATNGAVTAVVPTRGGQGSHRGGRSVLDRRGYGSAGGGQPPGGAVQTAAATPWQLARQSTGLFEIHWWYGDNAFSCPDPANCKWQGN